MSSGVVLCEKHHALGVNLKGRDGFFKEARKSKKTEEEQVIRATETKTKKKREGKEKESSEKKRQEGKVCNCLGVRSGDILNINFIIFIDIKG